MAEPGAGVAWVRLASTLAPLKGSMAASDFRINSMVRSLLARHWIDLKRVQVSSFRGTVRLTGEIARLGSEGLGSRDHELLDVVEAEVRALPDVERIYVEVTNWRRTEGGHWVCVDTANAAKPAIHTTVGDGATIDLGTGGPAPGPPSGGAR